MILFVRSDARLTLVKQTYYTGGAPAGRHGAGIQSTHAIVDARPLGGEGTARVPDLIPAGCLSVSWQEAGRIRMYLGIDLGGTKITAAVVDVAGGGRVAARETIPTDSYEGPTAVLDRMAALACAVCAAADVQPGDLDALGLGLPGPFDQITGRTLFLPNLVGMWRNVPVVEHLRAHLPCPIWLINDARAFVLAEAVFGAGRDAYTICGLTVGTGIGGGIAIGGRLHCGLDGTAGEVGHMTIDPYGPPCGCGNQGCLEMYVGRPGARPPENDPDPRSRPE
jgi:predicted NBD/HSP70 family sugar kinase